MRLFEATATVTDIDAFVSRLGAIGDDHGVTVQAFDARLVVDRAHLERAVALADRALDRGENVARDRAVEILCYAAGRRQINRAMELGVATGECPVVVLVDAGPATQREAAEAAAVATLESMPELTPAATLGDVDRERVRAVFDVSDAELAAAEGDLSALVRERVALLDVEK